MNLYSAWLTEEAPYTCGFDIDTRVERRSSPGEHGTVTGTRLGAHSLFVFVRWDDGPTGGRGGMFAVLADYAPDGSNVHLDSELRISASQAPAADPIIPPGPERFEQLALAGTAPTTTKEN
jgi:hypothetical protein